MRIKEFEVPSKVTTYEEAIKHIAQQLEINLTREGLGEIEVLEELIRSLLAKDRSLSPIAYLNAIARALDTFSPASLLESEKKEKALAFIQGAQFFAIQIKKNTTLR